MLSGAYVYAQAPPATPPTLGPFRPIWNVQLEGLLTASPAFSGARGFFPMDGGLAAYDLKDGSRLWTSKYSVSLQPATGAGLVFAAEATRLFAVREDDGDLVWEQPFSDPLATPLVWDNGWLIAATESGSILAFRGSDGERIWSAEVGAVASARPALAADRVYVPVSDGRVVALQVESGKTLWARELGGAPNDVLALDDRLYVGSDDNYFYCIKTDVGIVDWRWPTGADVVGLPVADRERVYFVSKDNLLRGLNRRSGNQRWKRTLPIRPLHGPIEAEGSLIVSGVAPLVRVYLAKDGSPAGEIAADGELASPPYVLPEAVAPTLILVSRHYEKGVILRSFSRAIAPKPAAPAAPTPAALPGQPAPTTQPPPAAPEIPANPPVPATPDPPAPVPPSPIVPPQL